MERRNKFINFERYFNANQDAATSQADRIAEQQRKAAEGAQQSTANLGKNFAYQAGVAQPQQLQTAQRPQSAAARTNIGTNSTPQPQAGTSYGQRMEADQRAQQGYQGPTQLSDVAGYDDVLRQNLAAQNGLNQLGNAGGIEALNQQMNPTLNEGQSRFSGALTGAAGRSKFDAIRSRFTLEDDWKKAEALAQQQGVQGAEKARADAAMWAEESDRQREATRPMDLGKIGAGITAGAGKATSTMGKAVDQTGKRSWADYSKADPLRGVYQAKRVVSPDDWVADAAGVKNPIDGFAAKTFSGGMHDENNNYSNMIDFGAVMPPGANGADLQEKVYNSMTQAEINEIGKMSRRDQQAWIMARMQQLGLLAEAPRTDAPKSSADMTGGANAGSDPNTLSDQELSAMGYMHERAPGESYAHYSDRISARKGG